MQFSVILSAVSVSRSIASARFAALKALLLCLRSLFSEDRPLRCHTAFAYPEHACSSEPMVFCPSGFEPMF